MAVARADDAPEPSQNQPAATPSAQKSGATGEHGGATPNSPAPEQHRLPPDSTTKQTLVLPGRTLAFTATAGSIRLFNDKREPQADIVYTAYQLDGAQPVTRPVTGRSLGLFATWKCRTLAVGHQCRCADFVRFARPPGQCRNLARLY
jgi:hypothetical protein